MGICLARQSTPNDVNASWKSPISDGNSKNNSGSFVISLDRVRALASNAAATSARYHCGGNGERKLEEDYEPMPKKVLGEGCNGLVIMAKGRHDGRKYALKKIDKTSVAARQLRQLVAEVEIYLALDHPHIAALRDVYETDTEISLLTELCEGGELYARLAKAGTYAEADAAEATHQMLLAVGYLHSHNVVHRDLKLENFLYETTEDKSPLKLIDFGFAKVWDPSILMMASCGSIAYVSPDVLQGHGYTNKCDLWSLGVIVFMLLSGYPPFHGSEKDMRVKILNGSVDWSHKSRWKHVSQDAVDFVKQLLVKDPGSRLDAAAALQHRWITSIKGASEAPMLSKDILRSLRKYANGTKVRRVVLQLLALELAPDETQELRRIFLETCRTSDGTIRLSELKTAIRGARDGSATPGSPMGAPSPKTPASILRREKSDVLDLLFQVLDSNADEQIYYSDFLAATVETRGQLRREAVQAAFTRLDADSSGGISAIDLKKVIGDTFEGVNVELLVKEADGTGRGELNFADFMRILDECDATPVSPMRRRVGLFSPEHFAQ
mmetsp:Transcript_10586/g.23103  ORF Transcript_10586/g.23103 Transcript_10586/m.23103 type:complete len:554 (-) Transcript_10586:327-1988(-)